MNTALRLLKEYEQSELKPSGLLRGRIIKCRHRKDRTYHGLHIFLSGGTLNSRVLNSTATGLYYPSTPWPIVHLSYCLEYNYTFTNS